MLRGGKLYQPILRDARTWQSLTRTDFSQPTALDRRVAILGERPCLDRARLIHEDLRKQTGLLDNPGATLLDIGCNIGFFHHYFLGYSLDHGGGDAMARARQFMHCVERLTGHVLYMEYDENCAELKTAELMEFLRNESGFHDVEIIGRSRDFARPILRCLRA